MRRQIVLSSISKRILLVMSFLMLGWLLIWGGAAHAADGDTNKPDNFRGILISPAGNRISLKNNDIYKGTMTVENSTSKRMHVKTSVGSYEIKNSNYNKPNYDSSSRYSVMKNWITLDKEDFYLDPGKTEVITYTVKSPSNPPAGMQYATIFAANIPDSNGNKGISAISRVGMVLSAHMVDGKTVDKFNIQREKIRGYQPTAPLKASFEVRNEGNIGADVSYSILVKNAINGSEVYKSATNTGSVFPETTRLFDVSWDKSSVGFYNVEMTINVNGRSHVVKKLVCTVPIWIILLLIIAIMSLVAYAIINYRLAKESRLGSRKRTTAKHNK